MATAKCTENECVLREATNYKPTDEYADKVTEIESANVASCKRKDGLHSHLNNKFEYLCHGKCYFIIRQNITSAGT